jgi:hypothetical protein
MLSETGAFLMNSKRTHMGNRGMMNDELEGLRGRIHPGILDVGRGRLEVTFS